MRWDRFTGLPVLPRSTCGTRHIFGKAWVSTLGPGTSDVCETGLGCIVPCTTYHPFISHRRDKYRAAAADKDVQGNWDGSSINERLLQSLSTAMTTLLSLQHQSVTEVLWFPDPVAPHLVGGIFSIIKEVLAC